MGLHSHARHAQFYHVMHWQLNESRFSRLELFPLYVYPLHSPLLGRESLLVSFPLLNYVLKFSG